MAVVAGTQARVRSGVAWRLAALRLLVAVVCAGTIGGAALGLVAALRSIPAIGETMHPEGWMLFSILRVRDGVPLYGNYHVEPFIIALYTPLYYYTVGLVARIAGFDLDGTILVARGLAFAAALVAAWAVYRLARMSGATSVGAGLGVGLFGVSYVVHPWAYTSRPDTLALALTLVGVWVAHRDARARGAVLAALVLGAAFFSKQSHVAAAAALTLWLLWRRDWTRAALLCATLGTLVAGGIALAQLLTGGQFAENVLHPNVLPMRIELAIGQLWTFSRMSAPLIALAIVGCATTWRRHPRHAVGDAVLMYALITLGIATFSLTKVGATYNHLFELSAALAVLSGRGFDWLTSSAGWAAPAVPPRPETTTGRPTNSALAVAAACWLGLLTPISFVALYAQGVPDRAPLVDAIRAAPGDVLTEHESLAALRGGKTPIAADPLGIGLLARMGRWDPRPLNERIERGDFALIVLVAPADEVTIFDGFEWWPPGARERIAEAYRLVGRLGDQYLYVPKSAGVGIASP